MAQMILSIMLLLITSSSLAANSSVHEYQLANGLKLLVKEDHRAPIVISEVWYKVGSTYEPTGITGISHALEHMMFRGTKKYGPSELAKIIADNGGQENAFTDYDFTTYYEMLSADKLPISFELEADRMHNLLLRPQDFNKEIQVVMEERRMRVDDNPQVATFERFMAAAFVTNPYRHMQIGWMNDLKNMTDEDVRNWYKQWYAPNNAIVIIVGDVKPQQVYALAQQYFGSIKAIPLPKLKPYRGEKPLGPRHIIVKLPAQLPYLLMGYNVPSLTTDRNSWQPYALDVIAGILSAGDSSRLSQHLIRGQQIAVSTSANYSIYSRLNNLFIMDGTPAPGHTISQLQQALLAQIKLLQTAQVTPQELERVKAQVIAAKVYNKDSITNQAQEIGTLEAVGLPWQLSDEYINKIEAITPQQIQMVAKKYFVPNRLTIAELNPLPLPKGYVPPAITSAPGDQHVR